MQFGGGVHFNSILDKDVRLVDVLGIRDVEEHEVGGLDVDVDGEGDWEPERIELSVRDVDGGLLVQFLVKLNDLDCDGE